MESINYSNREKALSILSKSFSKNPGVLWVVKKDEKIFSRIQELCHFCLDVSIQKKGAFISSDEKGVALIFKSWKKQNFFDFLFSYIRLGQKCISWPRAIRMVIREREILRRRLKNKHLYFWMLAVEDNSNGINTIVEIKDFVFAYSRKNQLPIYAETTLKEMLVLYLRYGFRIYDKWETGENEVVVYFIQRDWDA